MFPPSLLGPLCLALMTLCLSNMQNAWKLNDFLMDKNYRAHFIVCLVLKVRKVFVHIMCDGQT